MARDREQDNRRRKGDAVAIGAFVLAAAGLVYVVIEAARGHEWVATGALGLLFVAMAAWMGWYVYPRGPTPMFETTVFRPFMPLDGSSVWRRPLDTQRVVDSISPGNGALPVVVGASGAGKSTLLELLVEDALRRRLPNLEYRRIVASGETLNIDLDGLVADRDPQKHLVIVVDQFEQWLASVKHLARSERLCAERELTATLRRSLGAGDYTIVLGVRREWYFELSFLGPLAPAPSAACEIRGPLLEPARRSDQRDRMLEAITASFMRVLRDRRLVARILVELSVGGRIPPLEAQIVGAVLEHESRRRKTETTIDWNYFDERLGGRTGAVEAYFKAVLEAAERPDVCRKILCAMSVRTQFRKTARVAEVTASVYEDPEVVNEAVRHLTEIRLLVERDPSDAHELAHDFVAEFFLTNSASELPPLTRDNIRAFIEADGTVSGVVLPADSDTVERRWRLGRVIAIVLLGLMAARLLYFGLDWTLFDPRIARPVQHGLVDTTYIPILIPHALWVCYVALFYDRILIRLSESWYWRALSVLTLVSVVIAVIVGMLIPFAWVLTIAGGGVAWAAKLLTLSRRPELSRAARGRLRWVGATTLANLVIVGLFGILDLLYSLRHVDAANPTSIRQWVLINLLLTAGIAYWCLAVSFTHVRPSGVSEFLGLLGRPRRMAIAGDERVGGDVG